MDQAKYGGEEVDGVFGFGTSEDVIVRSIAVYAIRRDASCSPAPRLILAHSNQLTDHSSHSYP